MQSQLPPNRLRELRLGHGLKHYDISARFRMDPSTVWRWENGRSTIPDAIKLELAETYGVTVAYMMGWPEQVCDEASAPVAA